MARSRFRGKRNQTPPRTRSASFAEPAAPQRPVTDEVATAQNDIDLFAGWTTRMENPDRVLRYEAGGEGVKLYEELERDWQVHSMLQTRALAVQACEWQVDASSERRADRKAAEFVRQALAAANIDRLTTDLMQAVLTGYKPVEVMWEVSGGEVRVAEFRGRRPSRFIFDMEGGLRLLTPQNVFDGDPVPPRKFVVWTYGGHDWNPYGRGLGHQLYWPVWFKKNGVRFWMVFAEKFGSPTVVAKYPPGTAAGDQASLLDAIQAIQQQTGIRIPNTMDISLLEAARTSSNNGYEGLCEYMDRAIAKILLGQTLSSDSGDSGSYALGKVHDGVRREIVKADADSVCEYLNRTVIRWLVDYNFPVEQLSGYPRLWRRTEPPADLVALAARDKTILVDMGLKSRVPERYIEETYSIPLAKDGEATIGDAAGQASPVAPGAAPMPGNAPETAAFADAQGADDVAAYGQADVDRLVLASASDASAVFAAMLAPAMRVVDAAEDLPGLLTGLSNAYAKMDFRPLEQRIGRAMFAAALLGSAAVQAEIQSDPSSAEFAETFPFDLPFREAIEWFQAKGVAMSPGGWRDVWQQANNRSFTVARVTSLDMLSDIQDEVNRALSEGLDLREFRKRLTPKLQAKGWFADSGEKARIALPDGTFRKRLTPQRLETIYRMNLQSAYSAGRYQQMMAVAEFRPYWQYVSRDDSSVRPAHAAMNGRVYDHRHPVWLTWLPPNGWNCRCSVKSLSERDVQSRGLHVETGGPAGAPDEGFAYSVGAGGLDGGWTPDVSRAPTGAREQYYRQAAGQQQAKPIYD